MSVKSVAPDLLLERAGEVAHRVCWALVWNHDHRAALDRWRALMAQWHDATGEDLAEGP